MLLEKKKETPANMTGAMEPDAPVYEKGEVRAGVLESALHRLAVLEDRMGEMEERLRMLEGK